jgi:protein TonB
MEAKKNPGHDVHQQSFKFFLIGLGISVSLAITAFEWTTEKIDYPDTDVSYDPPLESRIQLLTTTEPPASSPIVEKKIPPSFQNFTPISLPENIADDIPEPDLAPDIHNLNPNTESLTYDVPEEDTTIFIRSEVQPKPVGGYELFYAQLSKKLNYPKQAIRNGIDGKVYVEFVVESTGKINQLKILKGIGAGCDEEAIRVLSLINWEPGKQRGIPVNVRMVMPVIFRVK